MSLFSLHNYKILKMIVMCPVVVTDLISYDISLNEAVKLSLKESQ